MPRFDSWCEWHRVYCFAAANPPDGLHTVRLEIDSKQPDKPSLLAERGVTMDNPERYEGTRWYAGAVLITGSLAEQDTLGGSVVRTGE